MGASSYRKKLIIILELSGDFKAGAQKRFLNLFRYLQTNRDDFYLLINESLYINCFKEGILCSTKNILVVSLKFDAQPGLQNQLLVTAQESSTTKKGNNISILHKILGKTKTLNKNFITWVHYTSKLYPILKTNEFTTAYTVFTGGIFSWPILSLLKIRHIYSYNDASASTVSKNIFNFFRSEYMVLKHATTIDFLSKQVVDNLEKKTRLKFENRKSITPNSFIDYTNFFPVFPKNTSVCFCSRFSKIKNPSLLLNAAKILYERGYKKLIFHFIGDGALMDEMKFFIASDFLDNVMLHGTLSHPEELLKHSSIFVSIQSDNNYPSQSLIEAMACENAIIASDIGETRLLVTETEGILVPLSSVKLADAIQFLIENPDICSHMGRNAREKVLREQTLESFANYFIHLS